MNIRRVFLFGVIGMSGVVIMYVVSLFLFRETRVVEIMHADESDVVARFVVDVADTAPKHILGLSYRERLKSDAGMLFVFDRPHIREFWMKDMRFPIDIIWIRDDVIVGIEHDVPAPKAETDYGDLPRYYSSVPVDEVLEINAGLAKSLDVRTGDRVKLK